jgi:hypothetical protein
MSTEHPYAIKYTEHVNKMLYKIAALLDMDDAEHTAIWAKAIDLLLLTAEQKLKGHTIVFVKPELQNVMEEHPKFFELLSDESVVEYLEPLVIKK